jgi:hypothetical protein
MDTAERNWFASVVSFFCRTIGRSADCDYKPSNGAVVAPGDTVTVQVTATANSFQSVQVIGGQGLGFTPPLQQPPYTFSLSIPNRYIGKVILTALGLTGSNQGLFSAPVALDSESTLVIQSVQASTSYVPLTRLGQSYPLRVLGVLPDGSVLDLTSSSFLAYASINNSVAVVNSAGLITAAGPGNTTVNCTYGGLSTQVQVSVANSIRGDFNNDGKVDTDDLNILDSYLTRRSRNQTGESVTMPEWASNY